MTTRRHFLAATVTAAVAGCSDGAGGGDGNGGDGAETNGAGSGTDTATDTESAATGSETTPSGDATVTDGTTVASPTGDATDDGTTAVGTGTARTSPAPLSVSTSAFDDGETIPEKYTFDGEDASPPLSIDSVPPDAETLAVVVDDPDAGNFVHWLLWNVPADTETIPEGIPQTETVDSLDGARQGTNGFGELGYRGPKPPKSHDAHTYRFTVYALSGPLDVEAGAKRDALDDARKPVTLDSARFTGEYNRG